MITTGDLSQFAVLLKILGYPSGGGITAEQVQEFAFNYNSAAGVNDAFIVDLNPPVTSLKDGLIVAMSSGSLQNNTTSPTLQINSLTPVPIVLWGGSVAPGDIETDASYLFIYNQATNTFQLINPSITTANSFLVQGNSYNNAIDNGAPDAYNVTLLVTPYSSKPIGFPVYMKVGAGNTNTGASTLTVNGETLPIILNDGSPLSAGMLVANQIAYLLYNGSDWVLMNPAPIEFFVTSVNSASNNQVIVDNTDPQNPILSTPQDIATTSDVQFNSARLANAGIKDANNNTIIRLNANASAVNYLEAYNAATGFPPQIVSAGSDTDIAMYLVAKGDKPVTLFGGYGGTFPFCILSGTGYQHVTNFNFSNTAASRTVTFPDSSGTVLFNTSLKAPTIQQFTSGSGTYTTPTNPAPLYIRVIAVGGGGGGQGGAGAGQGNGTSGGNTAFGGTLIVANGGANGAGSGGTVSIAAGAVGIGISGGRGGSAVQLINSSGGNGAPGAFGGAGNGGGAANPGNAGATGSGSGGGGGGASGSAASGSGGSAGAYADAIITSPAATYAYAVGAGGTGGAAGTGAGAGAAGGSGQIWVFEFYQ